MGRARSMTGLIGQELKGALPIGSRSLSHGLSGLMLKGWLQPGSSVVTLLIVTLFCVTLHLLFGFPLLITVVYSYFNKYCSSFVISVVSPFMSVLLELSGPDNLQNHNSSLSWDHNGGTSSLPMSGLQSR